MSLVEKVKGLVTGYSIKIGLEKGLKRVVQYIVTVLVGLSAANGVGMDPATVTVVVAGLLEVLRNFIKTKVPQVGRFL